ncbi:MAG: hypothetical protein DCC64_15015 [Planctomycetota bacterium]|nr:MAG: hypothetical protein DCC64_15015 [Planctomycetota bacterium]
MESGIAVPSMRSGRVPRLNMAGMAIQPHRPQRPMPRTAKSSQKAHCSAFWASGCATMSRVLASVIVWVVVSTGCSAAEPQKAQAQFSAHDGPPLLLDFDADLRVSDRFTWACARAMFRVPWPHLTGKPGHDARHSLGAVGFFDQGWRQSPNPCRVGLLACYTFGREFNEGGTFPFTVTPSDVYPWWRCDTGSAFVRGALGWMHARGTDDAARRDGLSSLDALRIEGHAGGGLILVQGQVHAALAVGLRPGSELVLELGVRVSLGRPLLPGALTIGYWYVHGGRIQGHYFTLGAEFDL